MKYKQISRTELEHIYDTMPVHEAVKHLDICLATFYRLLDTAGIPRKANRREGTVFELVD